MNTEAVLAAHSEACVAHIVDMALENGASLTDGDVQAREWAAIYLDDGQLCICNN